MSRTGAMFMEQQEDKDATIAYLVTALERIAALKAVTDKSKNVHTIWTAIEIAKGAIAKATP